MTSLAETMKTLLPIVMQAHKDIHKPKRGRFAPVNPVLTGDTVPHRRPKGGYREVPVFAAEHRSVARATARLATKAENYLREGGPV